MKVVLLVKNLILYLPLRLTLHILTARNSFPPHMVEFPLDPTSLHEGATLHNQILKEGGGGGMRQGRWMDMEAHGQTGIMCIHDARSETLRTKTKSVDAGLLGQAMLGR